MHLKQLKILQEEQRIVRILIVDNGEEIIIEVEDSGAGISEEVLDVLLQAKVSTKSDTIGDLVW